MEEPVHDGPDWSYLSPIYLSRSNKETAHFCSGTVEIRRKRMKYLYASFTFPQIVTKDESTDRSEYYDNLEASHISMPDNRGPNQCHIRDHADPTTSQRVWEADVPTSDRKNVATLNGRCWYTTSPCSTLGYSSIRSIEYMKLLVFLPSCHRHISSSICWSIS